MSESENKVKKLKETKKKITSATIKYNALFWIHSLHSILEYISNFKSTNLANHNDDEKKITMQNTTYRNFQAIRLTSNVKEE